MKQIHILLFFLFLTSGAIAQNLNNLEEQIDMITKDWAKDTPGGTIGIVHNGALIFKKSYGLASMEYNVKNTDNTLYNIASVSKQITAFAMVLLEQKGMIDLDDDVRKYLPEIPDFGNTITIRHLLTHTSGMRNFQNLLAMAGWRDGDPMTNDDLLKYMSMQKELNFPVGSEYLYCNTGFVLATFIVERVTGQDFKDWTKENIFNPLGMTHTEFREDMEVIHQNTATGYSCNEGNCIRPLEFYSYMGNGNVYTNADDFAKWIINFKSGKVGGASAIEALFTRGILNNGDTLNYALGIGNNDYRGKNRVTHGGSIGGYRSSMSYFPEYDFGVFVFTNGSEGNPTGKANEIIGYCLKEYLDSAPPYSLPVERLSIPGSTTPEAFQKIANDYMIQGINVKLYEREGNYYIFADGVLPELPLTPASDTSFFNQQADITIYANIRDRTIKGIFAGDYFFGRAADPSVKEPAFISQLVGEYYSEELDTKYVIEVMDDELFVTHRRHYPAKVSLESKNKFSTEGFHFAEAEIVYKDSKIKGLKVSNGRVQNLWFEKVK